MIPVFIYCSSVFVFLMLYYFYKPFDENNKQGHSQQQQKVQQAFDLVDSSNLTPVTLVSNEHDIASSTNPHNNSLIKRAHYLNKNLTRCDSNSSIQTYTNLNSLINSNNNNNNNDNNNNNSINSASNLSIANNLNQNNASSNSVCSIRASSTLGLSLMKKFVFYFKAYVLVYLLPVYKYLGLNDSSFYNAHQYRQNSLKSNNSSNRIEFNSNSSNNTSNNSNNYQIEDNYKTLDDLLAELNKLDILNYQQNINDSLFNFDTNSLLNISQNHHEFSCNLIIGIDFTASNEWKGRKTFNSQSLHKTLGNKVYNPYQKVLSALGFAVNKLIISSSVSTLPNSNKETLNSHPSFGYLLNCGLKIHAFGFGDQTTTDKAVFSLFDQPSMDNNLESFYADSFEDVLNRYNEIAKKIQLSGPTSFAPIIYKSIEIIKNQQLINQQKLINSDIQTQVKMPFHILFIIADGKISDENENESIQAIIDASQYPLSIVVIGVGDGPWNTMIKFDNRLCAMSKFDNFQFVDFHQAIKNSKTPEQAFALKAFMELPEQYKFMKQFNYI